VLLLQVAILPIDYIMTLNDWILIYKIIEYSASLLMVSLGVMSILFFKENNRILSYYFIINASVELTSLSVVHAQIINFPYISSLNHVLIISEVLLIGTFFKSFLKNKIQIGIIHVIMFVVIIYDLYTIIETHSILSSTQYISALLSTLLCIAGLMAFYEIAILKYSKQIFKQPNLIIVGSFIFIYTLLIIIFIFTPSIMKYSELATYQIFILRNFLIFLCLTGIGYGMWLKIKLQPTASPKPSQQPRVQN
jgi:hypothetical protein